MLACIDAETAERSLAAQRPNLLAWQEQGYCADMSYMQRSPQLLTSLSHLLPDVKHVLCMAIPYSREQVGCCPPGFGRVARYAWGKDYHRVLKKAVHRMMSLVLGPEIKGKYRAFADAVPLLERVLGAAAGNGFIGRNSLLIEPRLGSYNFLCEVLLGFDLKMDWTAPKLAGQASGLPQRSIAGAGCGSCRRCIPACPTSAIVADGIVDSNRCISYLTIEKRTAFTPWESQALGEWIFGCDICQEVCPFNQNAASDVIDSLASSSGSGPFLDLTQVMDIRTDSEYLRRFAGTPLMRPGRLGLIRNAISVAVNTHWTQGAERLLKAAVSDEAKQIRRHAAWALLELEKRSDGAEKRRMRAVIGQLENIA